MYIIYRFDEKSKDVVAHGDPFRSREDAVKSLVVEAQNYLSSYKRVETSTFVENISQCVAEGWYLIQNDEQVDLYKVINVPIKGWFSTYPSLVVEKMCSFSIMTIPTMNQVDACVVQETPRISRPTIRNNDLFTELLSVLKGRRDTIENSVTL